ncbi:NAD-dependent epimerase/dehydratase family protein [Azospirillum aestuarii]|uniref:NAD-dependent epimerase/dehydratase family protein n=1 Tax=Azospirillum aestuarii TaxID=2802052 RepID=UPI0040550A8F
MASAMAGRKIVITGGAGFIGHNLALSLKALGAKVDILDSLQVNNLNAFASNTNNLPNRDLYLSLIQQRLSMMFSADIPVHVIDVRDYHTTGRLLVDLQPDVIVHLAAVAHANVANKDPYSTFDHSLRTLENTLDYARQFGTHFVYFSSSMVYGDFPDGFVTEESTCNPLGIYGALKFSGEKMVIAYNQVFDLPYTIVRPSALYGERCVSRRVGQVFIENALQGLQLQVAGDGSDRLDFTYVADVVNGVARIIEDERSRNQIFNMTFGQSRSIAGMIDIVCSHFPDVSVTYSPRDRLMPSRGTLSMDKARRLLDFEPSFPVERGFPLYIDWYKKLFAERQKTPQAAAV